MQRKATVCRKTSETDITITLKLDGKGLAQIDTSIPFMDHMLTLLAAHGLFDLDVAAHGDRHVDDHHLIEDLGICLGQAFCEALGNKRNIGRYGSILLPMDESLCALSLDLSGRSWLVYQVPFTGRGGAFDWALLKEFMKSFSEHGRMTLHINVHYGSNDHHMAEAMFKALARSLRQAVTIQKGVRGIPSTKGSL